MQAQAAIGRTLHRVLEERRHLRERLYEIRQLRSKFAPDVGWFPAFVRPLPQQRLRGLPEIELRIELPTDSFDLQQRLLDQHQLRLDLRIESLRRLEQADQHLAEGNFFERLVCDRLADRSHRRLELIDAHVRWDPAGIQVQLRDASIVVIEERREVGRQIVLIARFERADDAEIDGRIAWVLGIIEQHEDVAWVHVGMEEVVAECLRKEDLDTVLREPLNIGAATLQLLDIVDEHAMHALHHHDILAAKVPIDLRDI